VKGDKADEREQMWPAQYSLACNAFNKGYMRQTYFEMAKIESLSVSNLEVVDHRNFFGGSPAAISKPSSISDPNT
jgi:hypothetical protein